MNLISKGFRLLLITALLFIFLLTYWFNLELYRGRPSLTQEKTMEIDKGLGLRQISYRLAEEKIIPYPPLFIFLFNFYYSPSSLKAGEYQIEPGESLKSIIIKMISGRVKLYQITIPEGLTALQIASLLSSLGKNDNFIEALNNPQLIADLDPQAENLEGYLFPETYFFPKGISPISAYKAMTDQFRRNFLPEWQARAKEMGFTVREIVTLASLIEKETGLSEERFLVSAVFHNRLKRGMKLDCDPTVLYALEKAGIKRKELLEKDLYFPSPYNTYLYPGLPPGPICNPGRESLQAALFPARVNFLYFVSKGDGTHYFSSSYQEHLKAVSLYRKNRSKTQANR